MVTLVPRHPDPSLLLETASQTPSRSQNLIFSTLLVCPFPVWLRKLSVQRAPVSHSGFAVCYTSHVGKWLHSLSLDSLVSGWDRDLSRSSPHSVASHGGTRSSRIRPSLLPLATFPLSPHPFCLCAPPPVCRTSGTRSWRKQRYWSSPWAT